MNSLRRLLVTLAALALCLGAASPAFASVGFRVLAVPDGKGGTMEAAAWYPAEAPVQTMSLGLIQQTAAMNAPMVGENLPLVVISHGNGGFWGGHSDTAIALAEAGFIAVALTHPGDNYLDQSHSTDLPARPRQLRALLDHVLGAWSESGRIDRKRIGAFGFSAGGFTVMAAAGGVADPEAVISHCRALPETFDCQLLARDPIKPADWQDWRRDDRIRAVVAAAPGLGYAFTGESLAAIELPVQLWQAANDQILAAPHHVEPVRDGLGDADFHRVEGAGHFDFLAPCRAEAAASEPFLCGSAPGFDRTAFHARFNAEVVRFFREALAP
jgi:predicted dienelactone hydrolase